MPTTPFTAEHEALRESVRRLVEGPLADAATAAEAGAVDTAPEAQCRTMGLFELDDVLAEVTAAQELGRLRSFGVVARLLDAMLAQGLGLAATAVARDTRGIDTDGAAVSGVLPGVVGAQLASACLLPVEGVVVDIDAADAAPVEQAHAWRGAAAATVTLHGAPCRTVTLAEDTAARMELREAAAAVGAAQRAWDDAVAYAQQRTAFGRPISKFQVNRHALAAVATRVTAAEALVHRVASAWTRGEPDRAAAGARLYAGTVANDAADLAVQLHGGYGYTSEYDVSRAWRDAHGLRAGDGDRRRRLAARGAAT